MSARCLLPIFLGVCVAPTLLASGVTASSAGGGVHVSLQHGGTAPVERRAWVAELVVRPASFRGTVQVIASGPSRLVARAQRGRRTYRARLVFPGPGRWTLTAQAGGSGSRLGSVTVAAAPRLTLSEPTGIAVEPNGSLLVVESGRHRLVRVDPATGRLTELATLGKPWGLAVSPARGVFVSDGGSLLRIAPTGTKDAIASADVGPIAVGPGGDVFYATARALYRLAGGSGTPRRLAADTALDSPHGLAVARDGAVLLADTNNGRILRVDPERAAVTVFATLEHPRGIAVAGDGTVYVAAADEHRIVRFSASGDRLGVVGPRLDDPYALAVASGGTVFAVEPGARGFIRSIAPDGRSSVVKAP